MSQEIRAARAPIRVLGIADPQVDVTGATSPQPLASFAWNPNGLAGPDTGRNSHGIGLRLFPARAGIGSSHGNRPHGPLERFIERDQNVAFYILASERHSRFIGTVRSPVLVERRSTARSAGAAAKKLFKEIAEPRALELELVSSATRPPAADRPLAGPGGGREFPPVFQSAPNWSYFLRLSGSLKTS